MKVVFYLRILGRGGYLVLCFVFLPKSGGKAEAGKFLYHSLLEATVFFFILHHLLSVVIYVKVSGPRSSCVVLKIKALPRGLASCPHAVPESVLALLLDLCSLHIFSFEIFYPTFSGDSHLMDRSRHLICRVDRNSNQIYQISNRMSDLPLKKVQRIITGKHI